MCVCMCVYIYIYVYGTNNINNAVCQFIASSSYNSFSWEVLQSNRPSPDRLMSVGCCVPD